MTISLKKETFDRRVADNKHQTTIASVSYIGNLDLALRMIPSKASFRINTEIYAPSPKFMIARWTCLPAC